MVLKLRFKYNHFPKDGISYYTVPHILFLLPIALLSIRAQTLIYAIWHRSKTDYHNPLSSSSILITDFFRYNSSSVFQRKPQVLIHTTSMKWMSTSIWCSSTPTGKFQFSLTARQLLLHMHISKRVAHLHCCKWYWIYFKIYARMLNLGICIGVFVCPHHIIFL